MVVAGERPGPRRLVVAPLTVTLSVLVAVVLVVVGAWLLSTAGGAAVISVGVALWWVALNVLIIGLVSGSAWRRTRAVVGGERVGPGLVAQVRAVRGGLYGVALEPPEDGPARDLHGFVSLRAGDADRLAERLNSLLQSLPESRLERVPPASASPATEPAVAAQIGTATPRRGLPLVSSFSEPEPEPDEEDSGRAEAPDRPRHHLDEEIAADETTVVPRRARRD